MYSKHKTKQGKLVFFIISKMEVLPVDWAQVKINEDIKGD